MSITGKDVQRAAGGGLAAHAGRVALTLVAVCGFLALLSFLVRVHATFLASKDELRNRPIYVGNNLRPSPSDSSVQPLWPEFPHSSPRRWHSSVINGVQILAEEWETSADVDSIFSYYRQQMTARGWQDATEEAFSLQPESREQKRGDLAVQDEQYLENYRKIMDSNLVFKRDRWSMHVMAAPSKDVLGRKLIHIYAAEVPSVKDFYLGIEAALTRPSGSANTPLEAVQQSGGDQYHTTMVAKSEDPAQAYQQALADLQGQGWRPVAVLPKQKAPASNFVWLSRGKQYAALSVNPAGRGRGSTVTFIEVTPKSR